MGLRRADCEPGVSLFVGHEALGDLVRCEFGVGRMDVPQARVRMQVITDAVLRVHNKNKIYCRDSKNHNTKRASLQAALHSPSPAGLMYVTKVFGLILRGKLQPNLCPNEPFTGCHRNPNHNRLSMSSSLRRHIIQTSQNMQGFASTCNHLQMSWRTAPTNYFLFAAEGAVSPEKAWARG